MSSPFRCAIYLRLSKEDVEKHHAESESIQNQRALLLDYAAKQKWIVHEIYCDEDYSGTDRLRPAFNRMLADAQQGQFQILLCKSQSRFTRDMELVEKYLHGLFPVWGIRFIAVADNADTEIKGNKKARQINGLVNEWYLEDLSENIRMVFDLKRREGQYIGGSPLYGYRKDPTHRNKLMVDPEAAAVVRQIFRWSLEGMGRQAIAQKLNDLGVPNPSRYKAEQGLVCNHPARSPLWNKTTVWRILRNEMYTGVMVQGRTQKVSYKSSATRALPPQQWYRVEGTHQPIVDTVSFQAVQKGLSLRRRNTIPGEAHPLSGLVKCLDCGRSLTKTSNGRRETGQVFYLRCGTYAHSGQQKLCSRHSIRLDQLTELVCGQLLHHIRTSGLWNLQLLSSQEPPCRKEERRALTRQLDQRNLALKNLYLDRVSGLLSEDQFRELSTSLSQDKVRLESLLEALEAPSSPTPPVLSDTLTPTTIPGALIALLVEKIEVGERAPDSGEQAVVITWKF